MNTTRRSFLKAASGLLLPAVGMEIEEPVKRFWRGWSVEPAGGDESLVDDGLHGFHSQALGYTKRVVSVTTHGALPLGGLIEIDGAYYHVVQTSPDVARLGEWRSLVVPVLVGTPR